MFPLISMICISLLTGCGDNAAKEAQSSQQSRQIFAMDSEITAIRREMQEPVRDVTQELDAARNDAAELDRKIALEEENLKRELARQKESLAKFGDYRKQYVLENK